MVKNSKRKIQNYLPNTPISIIITILAILCLFGLFYWINFQLAEEKLADGQLSIIQNGVSKEQTFESKGENRTIKGRVTEKRQSCGMEKLHSDGSIKKGPGICDAGNSITINDEISISTGGGALAATALMPAYISNIDSIHAGDTVEVRYVVDENGRKSTNCAQCFVKK